MRPDQDPSDEDTGPRDPRDTDFMAALHEAVLRHREDADQFDEGQVEAFLVKAPPDAFETLTSDLIANLDRRAPRHFRRMRRQQRGFERRLRQRWGTPLDQYRILLLCMMEQGETFNHQRGPGDGPLGSALVGIHAKACRVAFEVHTLLDAGLGMGALARCRTLHEMAVIAATLTDWHGPKPLLIPDLAERYAARAAVIAYSDALEYQKNAAALGHDPFTDREMEAMRRDRDELVAVYGDALKDRDYGWASGVGQRARPSFADLEREAGLSHLRSYYRRANHEVHADFHGVLTNVIGGHDNRILLAGPTNAGLGDAGQSPLMSLHQITTYMIVSGGHPPGPTALIGLRATKRMLERVCGEFADAERDIQTAIERETQTPE